jgi:hypothetical protein
MASVVRRLEAVEAILRGVPALARPERFELGGRMLWRADDHDPNRQQLFSYEYRLRFWVPSREEDGDVYRTINVTVNPYPELLFWTPTRGPVGRDGESMEGGFYMQPDARPFAGGVMHDGLAPPVTSSVQVLFVAGAEPMFLPVSRERYLRSLLPAAEAAEAQAAAAASGPTAYQRWVSEAPERKALRDQMIAQLEAMGSREEAARLRETLERQELEVGARLQANEARDLELMAQSAALSSGVAGDLRAKLAGMSSEELAMQACWDPAVALVEAVFVPPGTPGALCMIAGNPAFYATGASPVEARAILLQTEIDGSTFRYNPLLNPAVLEAFETLDWGALKSLLDPAVR